MPKTSSDLYRRGNVNGPRMTKVRVGKDIATFQVNGIEWVALQSGGISTFSNQGPGKNWWMLPIGFDYPDELIVVNDHGNHFSWEPAIDMKLDDYVDLLAFVELAFAKVS